MNYEGDVMDINRKQLLKELQTVEIGLAAKVTVQQSDCFVFQKGEVLTYNNEVACRASCCLPITGAINAKKMMDMVERSNDDIIAFDMKKKRLAYSGKAKKGYLRMEQKVLLPIQDLNMPSKWLALPKGFTEAAMLVAECAAKSRNIPHFSCVHLTRKWIEGCDGYQAGRVLMKMPFKEPVLVRAIVLKRVMGLEVDSIGFTPNWVHFKSSNGLIVSTLQQKQVDKYPGEKLSKMFRIKGAKAKLPKGLKELVDRVTVFLDDDEDSQWLTVSIEDGRAEITGCGQYGAQAERKKIKYEGEPIAFNIAPRLLRELTTKNDRCEISDRLIRVQKDDFTYITTLWIPNEEEKGKSKKK